MNLKSLLLSRLSEKNIEKVRWLRDQSILLANPRNLVRIGQVFKTDKWGSHWYLQHYQSHFAPFRKKRINLMEIGVGGYSDPNQGGNSLYTWKAYFTNANIVGIDIHDKRKLQQNRIKIFQGSQVDEAFLRSVVREIGGVDIVIDDGSHINSHVIETFKILFPLLRDGGIYCVEDMQTSYWPGFGGSSDDLQSNATIMGYFASLLHSLNYEEILREDYSPTEFDRHIVAMHFYHNLVFIYKGSNCEGSNLLKQNSAKSPVVFEGLAGNGG